MGTEKKMERFSLKIYDVVEKGQILKFPLTSLSFVFMRRNDDGGLWLCGWASLRRSEIRCLNYKVVLKISLDYVNCISRVDIATKKHLLFSFLARDYLPGHSASHGLVQFENCTLFQENGISLALIWLVKRHLSF